VTLATLSALYVATRDLEGLLQAIRSHAGQPAAETTDEARLEDDAAFYAGDEFFDGLAPRPRTFAVGVQEPGWVTVHVGAFEGVGELADSLSQRLAVRVVVAQGQTTSEAWRISVHEEGRAIRHVEFAEGEWLVQEGAPLAFEADPLGTNVAEPGEEPWYDFGFDEAAAYCEGLGFRFWSDTQPTEGWVLIRGAEPLGSGSANDRDAGRTEGGGKPWWRRWFGLALLVTCVVPAGCGGSEADGFVRVEAGGLEFTVAEPVFRVIRVRDELFLVELAQRRPGVAPGATIQWQMQMRSLADLFEGPLDLWEVDASGMGPMSVFTASDDLAMHGQDSSGLTVQLEPLGDDAVEGSFSGSQFVRVSMSRDGTEEVDIRARFRAELEYRP
jgi:hypothetical protein